MKYLPLIENVIQFTCKHFGLSPEDTSDFESHVKLRLIEDDYAVFRKFRKKCTMKTYLTTVINHLCQDYLNKKWGKWRPSNVAKRLGPKAVLLEQLIFRDGHSFDEAAQILNVNHHIKTPLPSLAEMAAQFPHRNPRTLLSDEILANMHCSERHSESTLIQKQTDRVRIEVNGLLGREINRLQRKDRLLIRLRFQEGMQFVQIAKTLNLEVKPLYKRVEKILKHLQKKLNNEGFNKQNILDILNEK